MKTITVIPGIVSILAALSLIGRAEAQVTAFTYQGRLQSGGSPATGSYDFTASLYNAQSGGTRLAAPVTNSSVTISNGLFTILIDFGSLTGGTNWIEIGTRTNGSGPFVTLAPRQQLTPSPYAIFAETAGSVSSSNFAGTYTNTVTFNNGSDEFFGTFSGEFFGPAFIGGSFSGMHFGDGSGLYNLNASQLGGGTVPDARLSANIARTNQVWLLNGNGGTVPGPNFLGTTDNTAIEIRANGQRALRVEPATPDSPNIIGGYSNNFVSAGISGATIAGGGLNGATNRIVGNGYNGAIGGGRNNSVNSFNGVVGGGANNTAFENASVVGGGSENYAGAGHSVIAGGQYNFIQANSDYSVIAAGLQNTIRPAAPYAVVAGGVANTNGGFATLIGAGQGNSTVGSDAGVLGGGYFNSISSSSAATISGGQSNVISINGDHATIAGGGGNTIFGSASLPVYDTIGGGLNNTIQTNVSFGAIAGGVGNAIGATSHDSFVGSGTNNVIQTNSASSVIVGGSQNTIRFGASVSFIGGGAANSNGGFASFIGAGQGNNTYGADGGVLGGGYGNALGGSAAFIGGGQNNVAGTLADHAVIAGGGGNLVVGSASLPVYGVIGGGMSNAIPTNVAFATISGGAQNTNVGNYGSIGGGYNNSVSNLASTIPGGYRDIASGNVSFAAGQYAQATNDGAFVWSDASGQTTSSTNNNSVTMRASGGFRFFTSGASPSPGAYLAPFATSWTAISDRNAKKNFTPVDAEAVLEKLAGIDVERWNYKWESDGETPNIGPMAQDFKSAFYPGRDDKGISTLEFDGVELAAIQGLNSKLRRKETEIRDLRERNESLEHRLKHLEERMQALEKKPPGNPQ